MISINTIFKNIFCITLESQPGAEHSERLEAAAAEFAKHNISFFIVPGIDGRKLNISEPMSSDEDSVVRKADYGCNLSHLTVAKLAKNLRLKNYLVFEDDVILANDFNEKFDKYITQLPINWSMLYLGGDNQQPVALGSAGPNMIGTNKTLTTHAYAVNETAYDQVIDALSHHEKVDLNMARVHAVDPGCYIMNPVIAGQRGGWSYILNKEVQNEHEFFKV